MTEASFSAWMLDLNLGRMHGRTAALSKWAILLTLFSYLRDALGCSYFKLAVNTDVYVLCSCATKDSLTGRQ